jgi:probable HAF family extracellular repeat protein
MDVNDAGTIVGESQIATGQTRGFRKTALGGLTSLSTLGGDDSHAFGINNAGHVVGSAELSDGNRHAVAWWVYRIPDVRICVCRFPRPPLWLSAPRRFSITILGTGRLPVSLIDIRTVTLGDNDGNDTPALPPELRDGAVADRNGDGQPDLVVHFDQAQLMANGDLTAETRHLWLMGALLDRSNAVLGVWRVRVHP